MVAITISGALAVDVIRTYTVWCSIGLVAIPAISTIACMFPTEVRALFHRARTWAVQSLRSRKQLRSLVLSWVMPIAFLEGIIYNAARHQLDLAPWRDDIGLEDVVVY